MVGFIVLYAVFSLSWMWQVALAVGIVGITSDRLTRRIHKGWFWLAQIIGYVMSRAILGTLFLLVLLPIAAIAKLFRKDFMMLKNSYPSYFIERHHEYRRKDLEKPW